MAICAPCMLPGIKTALVGLTGAVGLSRTTDIIKKKKSRRKTKRKTKKKTKKKTRRKTFKKKTRRKTFKKKKTKQQKGGSNMTITDNEYANFSENVFDDYLKEKIQDQKDCKKKMIEGMEIRKEKNQPYNGNEVARIIADCDYDEDYCYLCDRFLKESKDAPKLSNPLPPLIKYLPPPVPIAARKLSKKELPSNRSMVVTAALNRIDTKKLRAQRRAQHLNEILFKKRLRKERNKILKKSRSEP